MFSFLSFSDFSSSSCAYNSSFFILYVIPLRNIPVDLDSDDGTQLGGVLVVGAGDSGILYEFKEKVFGGGYFRVYPLLVVDDSLCVFRNTEQEWI